MAKATRTINPLHFEDLDPHRFEDLVRQLAYDFRTWRSLEATGRSGSDEGMDVRGIERVDLTAEQEPDEPGDEDREAQLANGAPDRLWVIQCKREKSIRPSQARRIVADLFEQGEAAPYGYIMAAACDFSKKTRDAAAEELRKHGVQELYLWGKAELEDKLFQPKNDNLLFAYFGISLQIRRRSVRTDLRSKLTLKRKLVKELGGIGQPNYRPVLIRDTQDDDYPFLGNVDEFLKNPKWRYFEFHGHELPDHLAFVTKKYYASVDWNTGEWDFTKEHNAAIPNQPTLYGLDYNSWDAEGKSQLCLAFLNVKVPAQNRAWAIEIGLIPYEHVLLCDEIGDRYNEPPHLLIEYKPGGSPFRSYGQWLQPMVGYAGDRIFEPDPKKRVSIFPTPLPDLRDEWAAVLTRQEAERTKGGRVGR